MNADIVPINHCILCLVLNARNQEKNTVVCLASFLSLNGRILAHVEYIHVILSTYAYFEVRFHSMLSKCENSKNILYDVITNYLNCGKINNC